MANRYAPYKARYLTREPKVLCCRFKHNSNAEQLPNDFGSNSDYGDPWNKGIYSVQRTAAGVYKIKLGALTGNNTSGHESSRKETYARLAGCDVTFSETGLLAFVSNDQANTVADPFVQITIEATADGTDTNVSDNTFVILRFLDSTD